MAESCLLYYITDRRAFSGDKAARRRRLLEKIGEAACAGVDYIQLREKDLSGRELESLAREAVRIIVKLRVENRELRTAFLINSRTDVALAVGADGVHLRSDDVSPEDVKQIWSCGVGSPVRESSQRLPLIGASCHSPAEVIKAAATGASFAVFAPVFEKKDDPGAHSTGLSQLEQACQANIPVFALGGITLSNARSCLEAGAAGIAGIRLFQENDISEVVQHLRAGE
jgi:thiamine-phosphate pyrophosphorylase